MIPLKLFLDIVPSSSADITRALRECFRGEFISFRFKAKENLQRCGDVVFDILIQARELRLSVCFNTFRNFNRSLKKRRMPPAP